MSGIQSNLRANSFCEMQSCLHLSQRTGGQALYTFKFHAVWDGPRSYLHRKVIFDCLEEKSFINCRTLSLLKRFISNILWLITILNFISVTFTLCLVNPVVTISVSRVVLSLWLSDYHVTCKMHCTSIWCIEEWCLIFIYISTAIHEIFC